jgi:flagellin FlaB
MKNNNEMKETNLAAIGIGAMIVFIALILVAAVASAVIIQTGEKLQQNAQQSGSDTQREISGKISITNVLVYDEDYYLMYFETSPGSDVIDPNNVWWQMTCEDAATSSYQYVADDFGDELPAVPGTEDDPAREANFGATNADVFTPVGFADIAVDLTTELAGFIPGAAYAIFLNAGDSGLTGMGDCSANEVGNNGQITLWIHVNGGGSTYETLYIADSSYGSIVI